MKHDLLKSALADADDIKKLAIENAKKTLSETFEPVVKSLIDSHLAEEADEDEEEEDDMDEARKKKPAADELDEPEDSDGDEDGDDEDEEGSDESFDLDAILKEIDDEEKGESDEDEEDDEADESLEVDERKKAKAPAEEDEDGDEDGDEDEDDMDEDIDINQLLGELGEGSYDEEEEDEMDENVAKDALKKAGDMIKKAVGNSKDVAKKVDSFLAQVAKGMAQSDSAASGLPVPNKQDEVKQLKQELQEAKRMNKKLAATLSETNLLNAKLMYFGKVVKDNDDLSQEKKLKIMNTFDKATTIQEAKLVYESLSNAFKTKKPIKKTSIKESLGMASKSAGTSTARKQEPIVENAFVKRMQELAGLSD